MGCSYDPMPYTHVPSPREQWMTENKFGEATTGYMGARVGSYCHECGAILAGDRYGIRYLALHCGWCPVTPREVVPMKTEEECKAFARTEYH